MKLKVRPSGPQVRGASFLVQRKRGFVCFATGSGKSLLEILVGMRLIADGKMDKYIIVGTLSSMIEIEADFLKLTTIVPFKITDMGSLQEFVHGGSKFGVMMYGALTSMVTAWEEKPFKLGEDPGEKRVPDLGKLNQVAVLLSECRIGVSFDEYHTLKNPEAFLTRCFRVLLPYFSHVYGATATALMSKVYDLFHLVSLMDPKVFGSKRSFEDSYLVRRRKRVGRREIWEIVSFKRLDELNKALADIVINHFPVRSLNFSRRMTSLDNEADYFRAAEGVFGEKDSSGRQKAHSARLIDLQMVVNRSENKKKELLKILAERISQGVLLYCSFYETVDIVAEVLKGAGIAYREINGKMDGPERKESKDWFVGDPKNKALVITRAGGQSLNLQATPTIVFYDIPFGVGYFIQIMGRVVREFSAFKEFNIEFVVVEGTIDEYKFEIISANRELFEQIFCNTMIPESDQMESFSGEIINKLRKQLLWRRKRF